MQIEPKAISKMKQFHKLVLTIDNTFPINSITALKKQIKNSSKNLKKSLNETELLTFIKNEMKILNEKKVLKSILPTPKNSKILTSNNFKWIEDLGLTLKEANDLRLFKGVAMSAGIKKDTDIETENNVIFASGAMAAAALQNKSNIDIDHFEDALPTDGDYSDYDVNAINKTYPPASTLAVGIAKNEMGESKTPTIQTEFIGICSNAKVYQMIENGDFIGCSTVELFAKKNCGCKNANHDCACTLEGSQFTDNTLVLKGVPNSEGTWVSALDKNDIGTILVKEGTAKNKFTIKNKQKIIKALKATYHKSNNSNDDAALLPDLSKFKNQKGEWHNGKESIVDFLTNERKISEEISNGIADHIEKNPKMLNDTQLIYMSNDDLTEWFTHLNLRNSQLKKQQNSVKNLDRKFNAHVTQLTKEEANYGPGEDGSFCSECRWFITSEDEEPTGETIGGCQLVEGSIIGNQTCDRFEALPGGDAPTGDDTDDDTTDDTTEDATTEDAENLDVEEPNADGECREGFELQTINGVEVCVMIESDDDIDDVEVEQMEPDENGECPEGFELQDVDGAEMCVKITVDNELLTPAQKKLLQNKKKATPNSIQESHPSTTQNDEIQKINNEITNLKLDLRKSEYLIGNTKENRTLMGDRVGIQNKIKELEQKKRQFV